MADPSLTFEPSTTDALRGSLVVKGVTTNYTLHFGDGFARAGKPNERHDYTWPQAAAYTAALVRDGERTPFLLTPFRVLAQPQPNVTVVPSPDSDYTARLTFNDPADGPIGRFSITWASGEEPQEVIGVPGTWIEHYYPTTGQHVLRVVDHWSGFKKVERVTIPVPVVDPDATIVEDTTDTTHFTAKLEVTHSSGAAGRKLTIEWGEGAVEEISAAVGTTVTHKYDFTGDYLVWVYYSDDANGKVKFLDVTVPFAAEATS